MVVSRNAASQLASCVVCPWLACLHLAKTSHSCRCPLRHSFLRPVPAHFDQPVTTHTGNTARHSMMDLCFCPQWIRGWCFLSVSAELLLAVCACVCVSAIINAHVCMCFYISACMYVCEHKVTFHFILYFDGTSAEEQAIRKVKKGPEEGGSVS